MMNFNYGQVLLKMLYDIELEDEIYEELGLVAWELIGNKNVKLYKYSIPIDCIDNSVTLPCNALEGKVEAVTSNYEDWERVTNYSDLGDVGTAYAEMYTESLKFFTNPLYISGKLLPYERVGDKLYFSNNFGTVNILYKGIIVDDEGLPEISEKEARAIATYIAYILKFKEGLTTNNVNTIRMAEILKLEWNKLCDLARVQYLNLNDLNNILDVKSSWERKHYNKTYKPLR